MLRYGSISPGVSVNRRKKSSFHPAVSQVSEYQIKLLKKKFFIHLFFTVKTPWHSPRKIFFSCNSRQNEIGKNRAQI
ncbi:MAG TPA: hypothetical protein DHV17_09140 [Chitinophagaceae bacterium]|nr:hypothetical protein [Chitinophagaceae bacterium]